MEITPNVEDMILHAEGKALATYGKHGINVVPVSTVRIKDGKILLMNYFFKKTLDNIIDNKSISLSCWRGLEGYQIKGQVEYVDTGDQFEEARAWINNNVPNRILLGLLIILPIEIHNISPGAN
ncbi:MAG: hypothetical protein KBC00_04555 [Candidatus Levybacteria bacterium]|jgi:hypothetical protein|nr:hypothetical protein [Candidatus Levybacteria bacterium]